MNVQGTSRDFNTWFGNWQDSLNAAGITCFLYVVAAQGTGANAYFNATLAMLFVVWEHYYIIIKKFPILLKKFRKHPDPEVRKLAKEITKEYIGLCRLICSYFPYWVGHIYLVIFAFYPATSGNDISLYVPNFGAYIEQ